MALAGGQETPCILHMSNTLVIAEAEKYPVKHPHNVSAKHKRGKSWKIKNSANRIFIDGLSGMAQDCYHAWWEPSWNSVHADRRQVHRGLYIVVIRAKKLTGAGIGIGEPPQICRAAVCKPRFRSSCGHDRRCLCQTIIGRHHPHGRRCSPQQVWGTLGALFVAAYLAVKWRVCSRENQGRYPGKFPLPPTQQVL